MQTRSLLFILLCFFITSIQAQQLFVRNDAFKVFEDGRQLKFPWVGGLNNAQFLPIDINNDGIEDLVIYDRVNERAVRVLPFLNGGTANTVDYTYAPEYRNDFPHIQHWVATKDFNCDGAPDLFLSNPIKIDLWLGQYNASNRLEFNFEASIEYQTPAGPLFAEVTATDYPGIEDVDGDGDLDILTFALSGGVVDFIKNESMETTGTCGDTLLFSLGQECWGKFFEGSQTISLDLDTCDGAAKRGQRHPGSAVTIFDEDGDGDMELLLGDVNFNAINRVLNGGDSITAVAIEQDTTYPSYDKPVDIPIFPVTFLLDVDNDGLRDMIAAPNVLKGARTRHCSWWYKNVGTASQYTFEYQKDTFMIEDMIDVGEGANPTYFDYNADGLLDLVVGHVGYYLNGEDRQAGLALYENTGTSTTPEFTLITRNYLNLFPETFEATYPAFGDMDNDGDEDLLLGIEDGSMNYYENNAGPGNPASFAPAVNDYMNIDVGRYAAPEIADIDGDGLPDLLIGEESGNLNYYENNGTASNPSFFRNATNSQIGNIRIRLGILGYVNARVAELDNSGRRFIVAGNWAGALHLYQIDQDSIYNGSFNLFTGNYSQIDEGTRTALDIADINGDGFKDMVVGNLKGGLTMFSQITTTVGVEDDLIQDAVAFHLYPNPAKNSVTIEWEGSTTPTAIRVIDLLGREVANIHPAEGTHQIVTNVSNLTKGIYLVELYSTKGNSVKKLLID